MSNSKVRPFIIMYIVGAIVCALAVIAVRCADATRILGYNYGSATAPYVGSSGSTLDQLAGALTGGTLIGFVFAGGLAFSLAMATVLLFAHVHADGEGSGTLIARALLWGLVTAAVSIIMLMVLVFNLFSGVMISQMTGKGGSGMGIMLLGLLLVVGTLIAAASIVLHSVVTRSRVADHPARDLIVSTVACGAIVAFLTVATFGAIDREVTSLGSVCAWFAVGAVANCAILLLFARRGRVTERS